MPWSQLNRQKADKAETTVNRKPSTGSLQQSKPELQRMNTHWAILKNVK
jgi:hypothetical protein